MSDTAFGEFSHYAASSTEGILIEVDYSYDKLGRIIERTESVLGGTEKTYRYCYDSLGRLSEASDGTTIRNYAYDKTAIAAAAVTMPRIAC